MSPALSRNNGDGVIAGKDKDLDLPRAAKWTYSVGIDHDMDTGRWGYVNSRLSYTYRDDSAYTDNNLGYILDQNLIELRNNGIFVYCIEGLSEAALTGA